jgi:hypothetical protein
LKLGTIILLLFIAILTIPGCSTESNLVSPAITITNTGNTGHFKPDTVRVTSPYATIDKMYQVLGVSPGITSIGGVHKIKDGVNLPFSEYKYYDSTEVTTHDCIPVLTMCNDSQFVFVDSISSFSLPTIYDRHKYTMYGNDVVKDSVDSNVGHNWEQSTINTLTIKITENDTAIVMHDLIWDQNIGKLKKGTIDRTIDYYSAYGFEGRFKIIEFRK